MNHVKQICVAWVVMKPVVANVCQGKSAGWFDFIFLFVFIFMAYIVHIYHGNLIFIAPDFDWVRSNWNLKLVVKHLGCVSLKKSKIGF